MSLRLRGNGRKLQRREPLKREPQNPDTYRSRSSGNAPSSSGTYKFGFEDREDEGHKPVRTTSSAQVRRKIRTPPTSKCRYINKSPINININDIPEDRVTKAVYLGTEYNTSKRKPFHPYSCYTTSTKEAMKVYRSNCRFIIKAASREGTNRRVLLDHAMRMERWMIRLQHEDSNMLYSSLCPDEIKSFILPK